MWWGEGWGAPCLANTLHLLDFHWHLCCAFNSAENEWFLIVRRELCQTSYTSKIPSLFFSSNLPDIFGKFFVLKHFTRNRIVTFVTNSSSVFSLVTFKGCIWYTGSFSFRVKKVAVTKFFWIEMTQKQVRRDNFIQLKCNTWKVLHKQSCFCNNTVPFVFLPIPTFPSAQNSSVAR